MLGKQFFKSHFKAAKHGEAEKTLMKGFFIKCICDRCVFLIGQHPVAQIGVFSLMVLSMSSQRK